MSDCEAYRFAPCPFCGSEIRHVESWAKSFDPPRLYHEWQHVEDNSNECWIRRQRKIVGAASDDPNEQEAAIQSWNRRAQSQVIEIPYSLQHVDAPMVDENYTLPCDVFLEPATIIRKGCKLSTLLAAFKAREGQDWNTFDIADARETVERYRKAFEAVAEMIKPGVGTPVAGQP